jgi:hypothetical protein
VDLPGGALTTSVAIADMNNDGLLDIVIGNGYEKNQLLLNAGGGTFDDTVDLPGGTLNTRSVAIADMNNDGLLDIVIGNDAHNNQWLPLSSCPIGSARLHSKSWCFQCPSFMGQESSICRECMPDYMQQPGTSDYQCEVNYDENCPFGQRKLGEDECSKQCPDGTYFKDELTRSIDDPSTWDEDRCIPCSPGHFVADGIIIINKCLECLPGSYQPELGATTCLDCPYGEFQSEFGKEYCDSCTKGGYCNAVNKADGGFTPCPPGTYNDKMGQSSETACQLCPSGTYSTTSGGTSVDVCLECLPGTYNDQPGKFNYDNILFPLNLVIHRMATTQLHITKYLITFVFCSIASFLGQTKCEPCDPGTFQELSNQISCDACPRGTFTDKSGLQECFQCKPGTYQPNEKRSNCLSCQSGEFQSDFGKDYCDSCLKGGYCDAANKLDGGFTPCPPGTYNDKMGQSSETACQLCPSGTYSTTSGGTSVDVCLECLPGTYNGQPGKF